MPIAKAGMLFMKKLAKCSAATTTSASGFGRTDIVAHAKQGIVQRLAGLGVGPLGAGGDAGRVAAGAAIDQRHQPASRRSLEPYVVRLDALVAGGGIDALAHRAVELEPLAHALEIVVPFDLVQGREMHQELAVHTQHVEQADVRCDDRLPAPRRSTRIPPAPNRAPTRSARAVRGSRFS